MAYTCEDKRAHIEEVQKYLRGISYKNNKIPRIIPDGIYGIETIDAVKAFQNEYGIPVTGEVDETTWNALSSEYDDIMKMYTRPQYITPFPSPNYVLKIGEKGYLVYIIQSMLNTIAENYNNLLKVTINGEFDAQSENTVKAFQNISGLNQTGVIDINTWNMLAKTYNAQ